MDSKSDHEFTERSEKDEFLVETQPSDRTPVWDNGFLNVYIHVYRDEPLLGINYTV